MWELVVMAAGCGHNVYEDVQKVINLVFFVILNGVKNLFFNNIKNKDSRNTKASVTF
jgi:hypothetical protein